MCSMIMSSSLLVDCQYADIFYFNNTATTEIYTLSLHDALPILNLLLRLVAFLLFLNPQCLASISRWITASIAGLDRKSGSAGMPRPISYAVFCLKKKKTSLPILTHLPHLCQHIHNRHAARQNFK